MALGNLSGADLAAILQTIAAEADGGPTAGGTLTVNGVALGSFDYRVVTGHQTVSAFTDSEWFTPTADSRAAFVVVKGNLTIDSGQVFKPAARKLFTVLYVLGNLVVNGDLSMSGRGANHSASGSNIAAGAILLYTGTLSGVTNPTIPAAGAAGKAGVVSESGSPTAPADGTAGQSGGGGSGSTSSTGALNSGGSGAAGTAFSGGSGGGASYSSGGSAGGAGAANGGAGGAGAGFGGGGGGAGNPGGAGSGPGGAGASGTGGTLIVVCGGTYSGAGTVTAAGAVGGHGNGGVGAGGSGGGSVTVLCLVHTGPTPTAVGGAGGSGGYNGGPGSAGSARVLILPPATATVLASTPAFAVSATASLTITATLAAAASLSVSVGPVNLSAPGPLLAAPTIAFSSTAALRTPTAFTAAASVRFAVSAQMGGPALLFSVARIQFGASASLPPAILGRTTITLDGVPIRVLRNSVTIQDILNDAPNTCALTILPASGVPPPVVKQRLRIVVENNDTPGLLFAGSLQAVTTSYTLQPDQLTYPCQAIDDTAQLNAVRPFGNWTNVSASTVALELCETFAPTFSPAQIAAGLPPVTITFDGSERFIGCLARLAAMIGGYSKVEDLTVYLFQTDTADPPDPVDVAHPFLASPAIAITRDVSQQRTRVYGRGHGEPLIGDYTPGDTVLAVADVSMFTSTGGLAIASTTPGGAASERLTYAGVQRGGGGTLVGPGAAPSTAPVLTRADGPGLGTGVYQYAVVDVTPSGKSLPSPIATVATVGASAVAAPAAPPQSVQQTDSPAHYGSGGSAPDYNATTQPPHIGDIVEYATSWSTSAGNDLLHETALSPASAPITVEQARGTPEGLTVAKLVSFYAQYAAPPTGVTFTHVWRRRNGGAWQALVYGGILTGLTGVNGYFLQDSAYPDSGVTPPTPNAVIPAQTQVSVNGIALGASPTTSRELYRTAVNDQQLKLLHTFADNTTTGPYMDSAADGTLGANAPTSDTSGLMQPSGQVNAGSTSLLVAGAGSFDAAGGWAILSGGQVIRYGRVGGLAALPYLVIAGAGADVNAGTHAYAHTIKTASGETVPSPLSVVIVPGSSAVRLYWAIGPPNTVERRLYRTVAGGSQLKLLLATTNNTGLYYDDHVLDAALGANAPTSDTAGLGSALGGIPSSGPGSITTTVLYGSQVLPAPALTGAAGLTKPLLRGAPVYVFVQRDAATAQAEYGVIEHLLVDERRAEASLVQLCDADLRRFAWPLATVQYATRDPKTKSGKTVVVNLASPPIGVTLTIQDVTITELQVAANTLPRYTVTASSVRFSLEDILRQLAGAAEQT